jgi:hypothetical protein
MSVQVMLPLWYSVTSSRAFLARPLSTGRRRAVAAPRSTCGGEWAGGRGRNQGKAGAVGP